MKNIAPAIFPPNGIGDTKPTNQAVLDWVHEIGKLTKPENIFWCDGSERENEFLIAESLKQNVLIKLNEKKFRARICTDPTRTTSRASRRSHSFVRRPKRKLGQQTTGRNRQTHIRNYMDC